MAFHLHRNGQSVPYEISVLRDMARRGELAQDEYVYVDEKGEWIGAAQVPELHGAWSLSENEATVAMEIPADFGAMFDELEARKKAQQAAVPEAPAPVAQPVRQSQPVSQPAPQRQAAPDPVPQRQMYEEPRASSGGGNSGGRSRGPARPVGETLDPTKTTIISFLCSIYGLIWFFKRISEVNQFLGEQRFSWWHFLIPVWGIIQLWKFLKSINEMAQLSGAQVDDGTVKYLVCWMCFMSLAIYFIQTDLNTIWSAANNRR